MSATSTKEAETNPSLARFQKDTEHHNAMLEILHKANASDIELTQGELKFDYFMAGTIAALCAYIANNYRPVQIAFLNDAAIQLFAIILLASSFYLSLLRIEGTLNFLRLTRQLVFNLEQNRVLLADLTREAENPVAVCSPTGQPILDRQTSEGINTGLVTRMKDVDSLLKEVAAANKVRTSYYRWRNELLLSGFIVLLAGKVLAGIHIKP